jgi:hypothetical protein
VPVNDLAVDLGRVMTLALRRTVFHAGERPPGDYEARYTMTEHLKARLDALPIRWEA